MYEPEQKRSETFEVEKSCAGKSKFSFGFSLPRPNTGGLQARRFASAIGAYCNRVASDETNGGNRNGAAHLARIRTIHCNEANG